MLSDEEKEAINRLYDVTHLTNGEHTEYIDIDNIATEEEYLDSCEGFCKATDIVLNLIEKQSKEIEELKAISEYREKIIKGLGLKTLPKTITGFKELIENNDKKWEDKIKAKIEELKETADEDNKDDFIRIEVLQSLLEKED